MGHWVENPLNFDALNLVAGTDPNDWALWIGAGVSRPLGYPLWGELVNRCIAQYFNEAEAAPLNQSIAAGKFLDALEVVAQRISNKALDNFFRKELSSGSKKSSPLHDAISSIWSDPKIVSLNLDQSFEQRLGKKIGRVLTPSDRSELGRYWNATGTMIKVHGCVDRQDTFVLTRSQYERAYSKESTLTELMNRLIERKSIFLGTSFVGDRAAEILESREDIWVSESVIILASSTDKSDAVLKRKFARMNICPLFFPVGRYDLIVDIVRHLFKQPIASGSPEVIQLASNGAMLESNLVTSSYASEEDDALDSMIKDIVIAQKFGDKSKYQAICEALQKRQTLSSELRFAADLVVFKMHSQMGDTRYVLEKYESLVSAAGSRERDMHKSSILRRAAFAASITGDGALAGSLLKECRKYERNAHSSATTSIYEILCAIAAGDESAILFDRPFMRGIQETYLRGVDQLDLTQWQFGLTKTMAQTLFVESAVRDIEGREKVSRRLQFAAYQLSRIVNASMLSEGFGELVHACSSRSSELGVRIENAMRGEEINVANQFRSRLAPIFTSGQDFLSAENWNLIIEECYT